MCSNGANPFEFVNVSKDKHGDLFPCPTCCPNNLTRNSHFYNNEAENNSPCDKSAKPTVKAFLPKTVVPKQEDFPNKIVMYNIPCSCKDRSPSFVPITEELIEHIKLMNESKECPENCCETDDTSLKCSHKSKKRCCEEHHNSIASENSKRNSNNIPFHNINRHSSTGKSLDENSNHQSFSKELNQTSSCLKITEKIITKRILKLYPDEERKFSQDQLRKIMERTAPFTCKDIVYHDDNHDNNKEKRTIKNKITDSYLDLLGDVLKVPKEDLQFLADDGDIESLVDEVENIERKSRSVSKEN